MFPVVIVTLLSLVGGASAADLIVSAGSTMTKNTTESFGYFMVAGRLTVGAGADLTFTSDSHLDGVETSGIRPEIIMNDGSFLVNARTNMGTDKVGNGGNYAYLTMNGGTFTCTGTFKFPDDSGGEHRIYLNGGIMHCGDIEQQHDRDAIIYVGGGILRLDDITGGDRNPQGWKDNGDLLLAEGYDEIVIEYIPAGPYTQVRAIRYDPNFASNPSPPDGGAVFDTEATLSWTPGENAAKHDVYFGTDFNDVNEATDPNVLPGRGRQDSNSYYVSGLELYKTYYWRIGEVNGPDPCMGKVWSFTPVQGYTNSLGMLFVRIPPGTFNMGYGNSPWLADDNGNDYDEQPEHLVQISKEFYILQTEVSDAHYWQSGLVGSANDVNWNDANAFCEWLSNLEGKTYRLPTEAEWEFVWEKPWGVLDMDEREWVQDWHRTYINDGQVDPVGPATGMLKVIRGGSESNRWALPTNAKYEPWYLGEAQACGFRVVLETEAPEVRYVAPPAFTQAAIKQSTAPALQGPDPCIPYFTVRFAMPIPPDNWDEVGALAGVCQSIAGHNHSPGFEIMPNGDALAVWFSGPYGSEYGPRVRFVQSRLRYGSDMWDMPELFWDMKGMNDESGLLWTESDGTVHFFGGGRIANSNRRPFVMAVSTDSGATWDLKRPYFPIPAVNFQAQPCQNAWRQDGNTIYTVTDGENPSESSIVWRSLDNGLTWYDMGGRTNTRHSTIVPLDDSGTLLSVGGKNNDIDGWMPWCKSTNWGASWDQQGPGIFAYLNGNQRPCVTRLASGKLVFVEDCQRKGDNAQPPGWTHGYGCLIAISDNNGDSWDIKKFPVTLPHESQKQYGTLGYSTVRQAPSGVIHVLTTMTHPCLHYELNEAWIYSVEGDIPPETTGGTVKDYNEYYPGGALRATWSARTCTNGRYLLDGTETMYYENGRMEYEATYNNGRKTGTETYWGPTGVKLWSWEHDDVNDMSVFRHWWSNGLKRIESNWENYPVARDLARNFSGLQANGPVYQWDRSGTPTDAYYLFPDRNILSESLAPPQTKDDIDLRTFAQNYLWRGMSGGEGYNEADLNKDGIVDLVDFAIFASQ
jgi:formylglycine-generating enzyme required for sulfatase activity